MLREPTFLILSAAAPEPLHGYGILQEVEKLSSGRLRLRAGTLYTALDRMTRDGWVEVDREQVVNGRMRRYYSLTLAGLEILRQEIAQLEQNATIARCQIALRADQGAA